MVKKVVVRMIYVFVLVMVFLPITGYATEESMSNTPHENIRSEEGQGVKVLQATFFVKLLGFAILMLNPDSPHNTIPLYAYQKLDENLLKELLKLANKGRVLAATIEFDNGDYIAHGISKSTADSLISETNLCDTGEAKSKSSTENNLNTTFTDPCAIGANDYIAFTRPLRGQDVAMQFAGKAAVWQ